MASQGIRSNAPHKASIRVLCALATARLTKACVDAPRLCAELLLAHALRCDRLALIVRADECPAPQESVLFETLLARREKGEPLAYILGVKEFFGRDFRVTPDTLIPRPETECLIEGILEAGVAHASNKNTPLRFADIGTGSGCIGITLALKRPHWRGCLLDISAPALAVAQANAHRHGVGDRVFAVRGTLTRLPLADTSLDILVSNPPYIGATEYIQLDKQVRDYEPRTALVPAPDDTHGFLHLKALAHSAGRLLISGGLCCVEHGAGQGAAARHFFSTAGGWTDIRTGRDLAGRERYCLCLRA